MSKRNSFSTLLQMHTYCRPANSPAERAFISRWIANLPNIHRDTFGNYHAYVGDSPIVWSSHTDTVHHKSGRQKLWLLPDGTLRLASGERASCLGADDTAGVFLCREMLLAGIPGHYIFHREEEIGGNGSNAIADMPGVLDSATIAIAFDRKGTADIITHQMYGRTASDTFAYSLAEQLNVTGLQYEPSDRGSFTDTANYADTIAECTNVSVGYEHAHTSRETLDTSHVMRLLGLLLRMDPNALVVERTPGDSFDVDPFDVDVCATDIVSADFSEREIYLDRTYADVQRELSAFTLRNRFRFDW